MSTEATENEAAESATTDAGTSEPAPTEATETVERRKLSFASYDEILAEVERLAAAPNVKMLGNWTLAQILEHLALAVDATVDGTKGRAPFMMRLMMWFMRGKMLRGLRNGDPMPSGFSIPATLERDFLPPTDVTLDAALDHFRKSVERVRAAETVAPHVAFGEISKEDHELVHCRHCAMHLGFAVPVS